MPSDLKQRIQAATLKSLTARNRYNDQVTAQLTQALKQAEDEVARAILKYRSLGSLPDNKLAALKGLEKLQLELDDTMKRLKREQTLVFRKTTKDSFKLGIQQGIGELADAADPLGVPPDVWIKVSAFIGVATILGRMAQAIWASRPPDPPA